MSRTLHDELAARALAFIDRRGGAGIRRGGRGRGSQQRKDPLLYAVTGFSAANYLKTQYPGGEAGVGTGFGTVVLGRVTSQAVSSAQRMLLTSRNAAAVGWGCETNGTHANLKFTAGNGTSALASPAYTFTASDIGRVFCFVGLLDATPLIRAVMNRVEWAAGTAFTGSYSPSTVPMSLGCLNGNGAFPESDGIEALSWATFRGTPTLAQLQEYCDRARSLGDLPSTMQGATITHRESVRDQLRGVANPAARKTSGAGPFSGTSGYQSAAGAGLGGAASGFTGAMVCTLYTGSAGAYLAWRASGASGWSVDVTGTSVRMTAYGSTTPVLTSPIQAFGTPQLIAWRHNGTTLSLWLGRTLVASGALTSYAVSSAAMKLGLAGGGWDFYEIGGANYAASDAEMAALFDGFDATGRMPRPAWMTDAWSVQDESTTSVPATLTNRLGGNGGSLTLSGTLEQRVYTATAPAAPLVLADTVTGAAADAMARQGSPTIVTIDPSRDGRRSLGAMGWSAANYLSHATACPGDTNGFAIAGVARLDSGLATANRVLVSRRDNGSPGWEVRTGTTHSAIYFALGASGGTIAPSFTIPSSDLNQYVPFVATFSGGTNGIGTIYWRTALQSASATTSGTFVPYASGPFMVGRRNTDVLPADAGISEIRCAHIAGGLTFTEVQALFATFDQTGKVGPMPARASQAWGYDLTLDELAAGDAVPPQVLDRVGTDHLTTKGGLTVASENGVSGLNNTSYYSTPSGTGPAAGSLAAGIAVAWWGRIDSQAVSGGNRFPFGQGNVVNTGCVFQTTGTNTSMYFRLGTGSALVDRSVAIAAGDVGTSQLFVGWLDPGTNTSRLFYKGAEVGSGAAVSAYSPGAVPLKLGNAGNGTDATDGGYTTFGGGVYQGVTLAEVLGLYTTLASIGRMPTVPGKTLWHVDLTQDVPAAGGKVPAIATDRTGTVNAALVGSGLQVAQRTERLWNYETSPIMASTSCPTTSDYWQTAAPVLIGGQASWWRAVPIIVTSQSVPSSAGRHIVSSCLGSPNRGWALYFSGTNSALLGTAANSSNAFTTLSFGAISSTDIGKVLFAFVVYDAPLGKLRAFVRRAEVGTGITQAGYAPADGIVRVTNGILSANPGEGFQVLGFMGGEGLPTLAEIQASHDAFLASDGDLLKAAIAGKTDYAQTFKGLTSAPATVTPLIGSTALTKVGAPSVVPLYARAAGW